MDNGVPPCLLSDSAHRANIYAKVLHARLSENASGPIETREEAGPVAGVDAFERAVKNRSTNPMSEPLRTNETDIRQIHVFLAVVRSGGFSAAQTILNLAQSTISTEVAALEVRLGYKLCFRGRSGFRLTPEGEAFVEDAGDLLTAISSFEINVAKHNKQGLGLVTIGIIDNLVTDPNCPLVAALHQFHANNFGRARVAIEVLWPDECERGVTSARLDMAIGIFERRHPHLVYQQLYKETDVLVCGRRHPLYAAEDDLTLFAKIRCAEKVVRSFFKLRDFFLLSGQLETITAQVESVEAAAFLILAGHHIGFLPDHYARGWIERGEMKALSARSFTRESEIALLRRKDASRLPAAATGMIDDLVKSCARTSQPSAMAIRP